MSRTYSVQPVVRVPHIFEPTSLYRDTKDPVVLYEKRRDIWHLYGSGGHSLSEQWNILHAVSPNGRDSWQELEPVSLHGLSITPHTCAPGMYIDDDGFHMFVQTEFMGPQGNIYYMHSLDGQHFHYINTAITNFPGTNQASMYDPHPAVITNADGKPQLFLTYSAGPDNGYGKPVHGDILLARSTTDSWKGPWERLGVILSHESVRHHNQHDHPDYEWGLEGAQLIQLPNGKVLLNAVCFLPEGARGTRQRVFFSIADGATGPYRSIGPVLDPIPDAWQSGENGHASGFVQEDTLYLYYQSRPQSEDSKWRYGVAQFNTNDLTVFN
jgi:hypothetical protein